MWIEFMMFVIITLVVVATLTIRSFRIFTFYSIRIQFVVVVV